MDRIDIAVTDIFGGLIVAKRHNASGTIHPLLPPLEKIDIYQRELQNSRSAVFKDSNAVQLISEVCVGVSCFRGCCS